MINHYRKLSIYAFFISGIVMLAFSSSHPTTANGGYTGAPGDGVCNQCHSVQSTIIDGNINVSGLPATVMPNTTYNLTVTNTVTAGSPVRTGFQVVALNDATITNAGDWTNNTGSSSLKTASGKEYFGHQPATMFNGNTSISWTADWTAPASTMDITFYAVGNLANGSGNSGDKIVFATENTMVSGGSVLTTSIINVVDVSCFGGEDGSAEVVATGGVMPYEYLWDNLETTATAFSLTAGTHTVTVTDDTGTQNVETVFIDEPTEIITGVNTTDVSCVGADDGTATLTPGGGAGGYSYMWPSGGSSNVETNLPAGTYFATVTDIDDCTDIVEVNINGPTAVGITLISEEDVTCFGFDNGSISVSASGGNQNYMYQWSNGDTGSFISGLEPDTYTLVVTDDNGCTAEDSYVITEPSQIVVMASATDETSSGANDGTATASASGGTGSLNFEWSNGMFGPTITNLPPDTYTVSVTDENLCEVVTTVVVNSGGCNLGVSSSFTNVLCHGESTASIDVEVGAGVSATYNWSNGAMTQDLNNIPAGQYTIEVTEGSCQEILTFNITEPDTLITSLTSQTDNTCSIDSNAELIIDVLGGTMDYTLTWSNGVTNDSTFIIVDTMMNIIDTIVNIPDTISNLPNGMISYILTDGNGCMVVDTFEIVHLDTIAPMAEFQDVNIYIDEDGVANPVFETDFIGTSFDNCGIESVNFVSGAFTCSDISSTFMQATLIDSSGNSTIDSFLVTVIDTIPPTITCMQNDTTINSCDTLFYTLPTATDNCIVASLELVSGFASGSIFPSGTTTVTYMATDDCGYSAICSFDVTVDIDLDVVIEAFDAGCPGASTGELDITVTGGTAPYSYEINPSNATGNIMGNTDTYVGLEADDYSILVTDATGCTFLSTFSIGTGYNLSVEETIQDASDFSVSDGSITLEVSSNSADPVTYTWTDATGAVVSTERDLLNALAGEYTLVVTYGDQDETCEEFFMYVIDVVSATYDLDEENLVISIFPNPTTDYLNIVNKTSDKVQLEYYSIRGEQIFSKDFGEAKTILLDIRNLNSGLYIMKINLEDKTVVRQFLKM